MNTEREEISEHELHRMFDEMLDETLDMVRIGSLEYSPSYALKELDPVAYRCEFNDWLDSCSDQFEYIDGNYYLVLKGE